MKVIFTRHGETKENLAGISMGQSIDGVLNDTGIAQAQKLAHRLKNEKIDYIYTSDLKRALDTARKIKIYHPKTKLVPKSALRERNLGIYEGSPRAHREKAMNHSSDPWHLFKPKAGESYEELQHRVKHFFDQLLKNHPSDSLLIVAHTGILTALFLYIFQKPLTLKEYQKYKPKNAAITICDFSSEGKCQKIHLLNSVEHLE